MADQHHGTSHRGFASMDQKAARDRREGRTRRACVRQCTRVQPGRGTRGRPQGRRGDQPQPTAHGSDRPRRRARSPRQCTAAAASGRSDANEGRSTTPAGLTAARSARLGCRSSPDAASRASTPVDGHRPARTVRRGEAPSTAQAWARMFNSRPNGSRTKKRRTPQGSSAGPYSSAMPAARMRCSTSCRLSTSIDRSGTGVPELRWRS